MIQTLQHWGDICPGIQVVAIHVQFLGAWLQLLFNWRIIGTPWNY